MRLFNFTEKAIWATKGTFVLHPTLVLFVYKKGNRANFTSQATPWGNGVIDKTCLPH